MCLEKYFYCSTRCLFERESVCVYIPSSYATCSTLGRISEQDIDITKQISHQS